MSLHPYHACGATDLQADIEAFNPCTAMQAPYHRLITLAVTAGSQVGYTVEKGGF